MSTEKDLLRIIDTYELMGLSSKDVLKIMESKGHDSMEIRRTIRLLAEKGKIILEIADVIDALERARFEGKSKLVIALL